MSSSVIKGSFAYHLYRKVAERAFRGLESMDMVGSSERKTRKRGPVYL